MKIAPININFKNSQKNEEPKKREFIDKLTDKITNPHDVNDCVAVPRGIFKAYLCIMGGFALISIGLALPQKMKHTKLALNIVGNICNFLSAVFFAKPFAVKGLSPTINRSEYKTEEK